MTAAAPTQPTQALTSRQRRVLTFVECFVARTGYPPSRLEICKGLGFRSPNAAEEFLHILKTKGYIELDPKVSRGIRLKKTL